MGRKQDKDPGKIIPLVTRRVPVRNKKRLLTCKFAQNITFVVERVPDLGYSYHESFVFKTKEISFNVRSF